MEVYIYFFCTALCVAECTKDSVTVKFHVPWPTVAVKMPFLSGGEIHVLERKWDGISVIRCSPVGCHQFVQGSHWYIQVIMSELCQFHEQINFCFMFFFSWAARMRIDICQHIDPWCCPNLKFLASDGTDLMTRYFCHIRKKLIPRM